MYVNKSIRRGREDRTLPYKITQQIAAEEKLTKQCETTILQLKKRILIIR